MINGRCGDNSGKKWFRDSISQTTEPITIVIYIIFEPQCGGEKNAS